MTGVHAKSSVNVEKAREVGQSILDSMTGKPAAEYSFTKSNHDVTFSAKSSIKVNGEMTQVDLQLLFQRLIIASQSLDGISSIFKYKLCSYPPSLFDSSLMLLKPQKPVLADAICAKLPSDATGPEGEVQYVLDGGALFHWTHWPRGFPKYREICDKYCRYVAGKYGAAVVVFDGYKQVPQKI